MNDQRRRKTDNEEGNPNLEGKVANVFAYVASALVGAKVTKTAVKHAHFQKYKDIEKMYLQDARLDRTEYRENAMREHAKSLGLPETIEVTVGSQKHERFPDMMGLPKLLNKVQVKFDKDLDELYKKNGYKGFHDFWITLDKEKQSEVAERGFVFFAVTLSALLTVLNSKSVSRFLTHQRDEGSKSR